MIKAIFFDIDGTLVSFKTHTIPASTVEAVNRAKAKGVKVFISTGRPLVHIDNLGELSFDGYITLNGGYCLTADKQVIYKQGMDSRDMEALVRYQTAGKEPFPCVFVSEHDLFMNYLNDDLAGVIKMINIKTPPQKDIREILNMDILQVMAYFRQDREGEIMREVFPHCISARWNPLFADVIAKGNSKRTGIDKMIAYYGIDLCDTMAFGDGGNDIPMLEHAAVGVAMGNATDEVKRSADYVTDSVDENGICNALEHFGVI